MASVVIAYGVVLAGLGLVLEKIAPALGRVAFIAGVAGGGLYLLWGVAALAGLKGRAWALLTTIAVTFVLLSQTVQVWMASRSEAAERLTVGLLVTVMLLLTIGMLMYLVHGERPPEFYQAKPSGGGNAASGQNGRQARGGRSQR